MAEHVRVHYQVELEQLERSALEGLDLVTTAIDRTMEAVEHQDVELGQIVIADDDRIDGRYLEVHQGILTLLATQSPVATDLSLISALLHILKNVERMGDQCVNICKLIPLAGHEPLTLRTAGLAGIEGGVAAYGGGPHFAEGTMTLGADGPQVSIWTWTVGE